MQFMSVLGRGVRMPVCRWLTGVALLGCGGRAERASEPHVDPGGNDPAVLVIPVEPREESLTALSFEEVGDGFEPFPGGSSIALALGEEYPSAVRFGLVGNYIVRENGAFLFAEDGWSAEGIASDSDELGVRLIDAQHFELEGRVAGDFSVTLEGMWTPREESEPSERPFAVVIPVSVRRVAAMNFHACASSPVNVVSGSPFAFARHEVFDDQGVSFLPANADSRRNVGMTVRAAPGTKLVAEDGIRSLVVEGPAQVVTIHADTGEEFSFNLIEPESVNGIDARFLFSASWLRGHTELESGGTVRLPWTQQEPGLIEVSPQLFVDEVPICSEWAPEWFELRSNTPSTCPETSVPAPDCTDCFDPVLATGVLAQGPGACEVVLEASSMNHGAGIATSLLVELVAPE
jgi:hypothetical protein